MSDVNAQALRAAIHDFVAVVTALNDSHPQAILLPAALTTPVTQEHVDILVQLSKNISSTNFSTDQGKSQANLHWLVLYEQFETKLLVAGVKLNVDELRQLSFSRHRQVRQEDVKAYEDWLAYYKDKIGYKGSDYSPMSFIKGWAAYNASATQSSASGATSESADPSTMSGQ